MEEQRCCGKPMILVGETGRKTQVCVIKDNKIEEIGIRDIMVYQCEKCKRIIID